MWPIRDAHCTAVQRQYSAYASLFVTAAGVAVHPTDQCRELTLLYPTDHTLALIEE